MEEFNFPFLKKKNRISVLVVAELKRFENVGRWYAYLDS